MKVIFINGSPHEFGVTYTAFEEMIKIFDKEGIESEIIQVGHLQLAACKACKWCRKEENAKCITEDIVNIAARKINEADGLVIGSPVHIGSATGPLITFLDRWNYSSKFDDLRGKVGASIVTARRSGLNVTFDELNRYILSKGMVLAGSQYWNNLHGDDHDEAIQDLEGLQTMRTLANNMVYLMKALKLGKEKYGLPATEVRQITNFIPKEYH